MSLEETAPTDLPLVSWFDAVKRKVRTLTLLEYLSLALCLAYLALFWQSLSKWWFNPHWTTDDALQQVFPFHAVLHPKIFEGDLIYKVMSGYLAPLHYLLGYVLTLILRDAILASHVMMLIQIASAAAFLFLAVKRVSGLAPALFALTWFFHTRHVIQRMNGGLPRGWATLLFTAFLYCLVSGKHRALLLLILAGCLLNPPGTFLIAAAYGLYLCVQLIPQSSRNESIRNLKRLALWSPLFVVVTLVVTHRPPEIGRIYSYRESLELPEFSRNGGRFSFVPFVPALKEIESFATRTFFGKFDHPSDFWRKTTIPIALGIVVLVSAVGLYRKRRTVPLELWCFLVASLTVYFLARVLAFQLYVPDRHINIPFAIFWIFALTTGVWNALHGLWGPPQGSSAGSSRFSSAWCSALGLAAVAFIVLSGSGLNLKTNANFNYSDARRGGWPQWLQSSTPETALIAGFPTFIDPVQLFGMRKGYATSETWHPFYTGYNKEMQRRLGISLRAHYARDLREFVSILEPEHIDFFVFERQRFYPEVLRHTIYYRLFQPLLDELTSRPPEQYAYRELPRDFDPIKYPFVPYRDRLSVVVDVNALRAYLHGQPT